MTALHIVVSAILAGIMTLTLWAIVQTIRSIRSHKPRLRVVRRLDRW